MKKLDLQKIIREEVKKALTEVVATKDDLDKIGDFVMSSSAFERMSPSKLKTAIKDIHDEWKAVASNYKNIEAYFDEMEEMGGEEAFMEGKSLKLKEAAVSKAQQAAAGIALSVKRGDAPASKLRDAGKAMSKMSDKELEKLAGTKTKELPKKVKKESKLNEKSGTIPVPGKPGYNLPLRINRSYQILDAGTDEWHEYTYLGEVGQGSSAGDPGDHMFYADDAPGVFVFVAIADEDLKTMVKPI